MYALLLIVTVLMFLLGIVFAMFFKKQTALAKAGQTILVPIGPSPTDIPSTIIPVTQPIQLSQHSGQMIVVPSAWRKERLKERRKERLKERRKERRKSRQNKA
jgi:hypothetical protein